MALSLVTGIGPQRFQTLLNCFGTPAAVWAASARDWQQAGMPATVVAALATYPQAAVERLFTWAESPQNHLLLWNDAAYPPLLRELPDKPPVLFVCGDVDCLQQPQMAIVGTRQPTAYGRRHGQQFATQLAQAGLVITSGLAKGIDTAAHQGALAGGGKTIAVMGTGLDRVYPAENRNLAHRIAENGALLSEFPLGVAAHSENFPRRNRLISGMSLGVLVVEAALRSGSLISARLAVEQNREVFALPGSIDSEQSRGCHALIRQGAKLVETVDDVLDELGPLAQAAMQLAQPPGAAPTSATAFPPLPDDLDDDQRNLLKNLEKFPQSAEELAILCGLTIPGVSGILLALELRGVVVAQPGGLYARHDAGSDQ